MMGSSALWFACDDATKEQASQLGSQQDDALLHWVTVADLDVCA